MSSTVSSSSSLPDRPLLLEPLLAGIPEGFYVGLIGSGPDGDVTLAANHALRTLLGAGPAAAEADIRPFAADRLADAAERTRLIERLRAAGSVRDFPIRLRRTDGSDLHVLVTAHARAEAPDGWLHVAALVRQRPPAGADSAASDYSARLDALGLTISGVAHELNNPLATIVSWAERLLERPLDGPAREIAEVIIAEAQRTARIARTLLTLGGNRQSTRAMVDLNQIVRETLERRIAEQQARGIRVATELAPGLPCVLADGQQLQQVLLNLTVNAEHAMVTAHGRGTLTVRTWYDAAQDRIAIEVRDSGPGLPPALRARVFDPFFTTKNAAEGTGLGLTVARTIVREHGGDIQVASEPGLGAAFVVELPVSGASRQPRASSGIEGRSVLLVDDERRLAEAVMAGLTDAGLEVHYAGDGEEALARIRMQRFDAVICDVQMPRVDGLGLYRAIAAAAPALARRVIFVTGAVTGAEAERFVAGTGCRSIAKPFRLADLLRAVRETLA